MLWQRDKVLDKVATYSCNTKRFKEPTKEDIRNSLFKLFEKEAEKNESTYTVD